MVQKSALAVGVEVCVAVRVELCSGVCDRTHKNALTGVWMGIIHTCNKYYICVYIDIYVCMYMYIYIYIYI